MSPRVSVSVITPNRYRGGGGWGLGWQEMGTREHTKARSWYMKKLEVIKINRDTGTLSSGYKIVKNRAPNF